MSAFEKAVDPKDHGIRLRTFKLETTPDGPTLWLHRILPVRCHHRAVLLTHGANTVSEIFLHPTGGLADFLSRHGFDVWLLDWRASPHVIDSLPEDDPLGFDMDSERRIFSVDQAAEQDLPQAVAKIREEIDPEASLSIAAHCVGAGALAMAIARKKLEVANIASFVLIGLGLFYKVTWRSYLKAENHILERIRSQSPTCRTIDPRIPEAWPPSLKEAYDFWPKQWLPEPRSTRDILPHLSFLIGKPWDWDKLHPTLQANLNRFFGPLHLGIYQHLGQMVRRGFAAPQDENELPDRHRGEAAPNDLDLIPFSNKKITMICAGRNQVWHRESLDMMYDWMRRSRSTRDRCKKIPVPGYNLQEILWHRNAERFIYPRIQEALLPLDHYGVQ